MRRPRPTPRLSKPAAPGRRISVLLVDDHTIVRKGIRSLLEMEKSIVVVGEAKDGRQAVEMAVSLDPDVILMDIGMPKLNGIEATRQILQAAPRSRVLVLSAHCDDVYIQDVIALGAVGFVLKSSSLQELSTAIRKTGGGGTFVVSDVQKRLFDPVPGPRKSPGSQAPKRVPRLSSREAEVLQLIAEGKANKQTAAELGISIKTVEKHRQRLMTKLDIHDVAGLVRYAVTAGIVECRIPAVAD